MAAANNTASTVSLNVKAVSALASTLLEQLENQEHVNGARVAEVKSQSQQLFDAATKIAASHSGSNFGYHGALYYRDFQVPPMGSMFNVEWGGIHGLQSGWNKREPDEVKRKIESVAGLTFAKLEEAVKGPVDSAKALHTELLVQLAPLHQLPDSNREKQLLDKLEHFDWKDSAHHDYAIAALKSFPNMTRDSAAASQGMMLTAHNYYEAVATQVRKSSEAIEEFWSLSARLLRQFQLVTSSNLVVYSDYTDHINLAARYERLKASTLLLAAFVSSVTLALGAVFALKRWPWPWLLANPNSYSIQWMSYAVLLLFLVGLFVRRFRRFCWGGALIPLVVGVLQSLGGPPHSP
jgi:hypothetical protein